jgi:hypothetical protein
MEVDAMELIVWMIVIHVGQGMITSPPVDEIRCKMAATKSAEGKWPLRPVFSLQPGETPMPNVVRTGPGWQVVEPDLVECRGIKMKDPKTS